MRINIRNSIVLTLLFLHWNFSSVFILCQLAEFGPYNIVFKKMALCKGPKAKDASSCYMEFSNTTFQCFVEVNVTAPCSVTQAKVLAYAVGEKTKKRVLSYDIPKPCEHLVFGPMLRASANLTNSCFFKKGSYNTVVNSADMTRLFYGNNFIYGEYSFKAYFICKNSNILCVSSVIDFKRANVTI